MHKHVEEGDTVQPGQPLVSFGHVEFLRVEAQVPVRLVSSLQEDDYVQVRLDTGDEVEARVARIFPLADPQRHTVTVKFDLPQGVRGGPGMHAAVHLPQGELSGNRVVIPRSALIPGVPCRAWPCLMARATSACAWCAWVADAATRWW